MKILMAGVKLIMVEARSRKASFLREAIRELSLQATSVLDIRVEDVAGDYDGTADLITMRALRASNPIAAAAARLLKPGGRLLLFGSHEPDVHAAFSLSNAARLPTGKLFSFERNSTVD
jgi:16S rRNA G527 N7-methylase RsmG